jgi:hypothetical protein
MPPTKIADDAAGAHGDAAHKTQVPHRETDDFIGRRDHYHRDFLERR